MAPRPPPPRRRQVTSESSQNSQSRVLGRFSPISFIASELNPPYSTSEVTPLPSSANAQAPSFSPITFEQEQQDSSSVALPASPPRAATLPHDRPSTGVTPIGHRHHQSADSPSTAALGAPPYTLVQASDARRLDFGEPESVVPPAEAATIAPRRTPAPTSATTTTTATTTANHQPAAPIRTSSRARNPNFNRFGDDFHVDNDTPSSRETSKKNTPALPVDRVDQLIRLITLETVQAVRNGERITAGQLQLLKALHSGTFCIPPKVPRGQPHSTVRCWLALRECMSTLSRAVFPGREQGVLWQWRCEARIFASTDRLDLSTGRWTPSPFKHVPAPLAIHQQLDALLRICF